MAEETTTIDINTSNDEETNLVKHLRETIKNGDSQREELKKQLNDLQSSKTEGDKQLQDKVKRLEYENIMSTKYSSLSDKKEDIWNIANDKGLDFDSAAALVLGQTVLSTPPAPNNSISFGSQISVSSSDRKLEEMNDEEIRQIADNHLKSIL